jgi:hypothetical protein
VIESSGGKVFVCSWKGKKGSMKFEMEVAKDTCTGGQTGIICRWSSGDAVEYKGIVDKITMDLRL